MRCMMPWAREKQLVVLTQCVCSGLHGYSHENPVAMTVEQQHAILDKTYKDLTKFCGKPPRGSVAPWWEASQEGAELMLKYGVEYGQHPPQASKPFSFEILSDVVDIIRPQPLAP